MIQNPQFMPQQATPSASAVNIQIFNPQAYASPNGQQAVIPQQGLDKQIYNYPTGSIFQPGQQAYGYQPVQMPAPQVMPQPVLQAAPEAQAQAQAPAQAPAQQPAVQAVGQPQPQPELNDVGTSEPSVPENAVDLNALNAGLQSTDINAQTDAITQIAQMSQATPDIALQVVDNQIMQSLIGIIQNDTSKLEGPNQQQIQVAEKAGKGEQLTPEEQAIFEQSSPRELAEKNKVFAMFTLAMLQKLQRDEIDTYNAENPAAQVAPIKLEELTGFSEVLNTLNTTQIPAVKVAAIQALSYASRPEDAPTLEAALGALTQDPDVAVQEAAKEALGKVSVPTGEVAQAPAEAQAVAQAPAEAPVQPADQAPTGTTQA